MCSLIVSVPCAQLWRKVDIFSSLISVPCAQLWNLCSLKLGMCPDGPGNGSLVGVATELQNKFTGKNRNTALARLVFRAAI